MKTKIFLLLITVFLGFIFFSCSDRGVEVQDDNTNINPLVPGRITVNAPSPGETIKPGTSYTIKWSSTANYGKIQIVLYRKRELKSIITISSESNGSFVWNVPPDMHNSIHYRLQIFCIDFPVVSVLSDYFYVLN